MWRTTEERDEARAIRSRRLPRCECCALPTGLCIASAPRLVTRTRLVVVVHRIEACKSTNTGLVAARLLEASTVCVRGCRPDGSDAARVSQALGRAIAGLDAPVPQGERLVLYPASDARELTRNDAPRDGREIVLVVPDGSWSQARKVLRRDDAARGATRVRLPIGAPSRYRLRRNPRPEALSTFEAIARALGVLEGPEIEASLMGVFDEFVDRALELRGRHGARLVADDAPTIR